MKLLTDAYFIPYALRLTQEERRQAWIANPPKPMPAFGYERTATQIAYYESIERDRARQRARDEVRWAELAKRKAAEKAELEAVRGAVKRRAK